MHFCTNVPSCGGTMNTMTDALRIGYGEDSHALREGKPLIIGGVTIPSTRGSVAHSDGDALLHAVSDALLGAFALGDIGLHFPPSNPDYQGLNSRVILQSTIQLIHDHVGEFQIMNISGVVMLDRPKLAPYRKKIEREVAIELGIEPTRVAFSFKTSEGMALNHIQTRVTLLAHIAQ